jgi:hypothetical protein
MSKTTLREILAQFRQHLVNGVMSDTPHRLTIDEAEAAINEYIEGIIGEDENSVMSDLEGHTSGVRDELRREQRKRAGINPTEKSAS